MSKYRKELSKKQSKKSFRKYSNQKQNTRKEMQVANMRGGYRL